MTFFLICFISRWPNCSVFGTTNFTKLFLEVVHKYTKALGLTANIPNGINTRLKNEDTRGAAVSPEQVPLNIEVPQNQNKQAYDKTS